jgi:hypothetical protein
MALTEVEADEHATRTAGGRDGGKRAIDTWHPALPGTEEAGDTERGRR